MINNYYRVFQQPFEFFDRSALEAQYSQQVLSTRNNSAGCQIMVPKQVFNLEAHKWVESHGCYIATAIIFYTRPGGILHWHTDGEQGDTAKFNWVWGAGDHTMWFAHQRDHITAHREPTSVGTFYDRFSHDQLRDITSVALAPAYMMNGMQPHRVRNLGTTGRWCLNMILMQDGRRLAWHRAVDLFGAHLV